MKKIRFIEVKSEIAAGTRGASMGPDAIKVAALDYGSNLFKKIDATEVPNENKQLFDAREVRTRSVSRRFMPCWNGWPTR